MDHISGTECLNQQKLILTGHLSTYVITPTLHMSVESESGS